MKDKSAQKFAANSIIEPKAMGRHHINIAQPKVQTSQKTLRSQGASYARQSPGISTVKTKSPAMTSSRNGFYSSPNTYMMPQTHFGFNRPKSQTCRRLSTLKQDPIRTSMALVAQVLKNQGKIQKIIKQQKSQNFDYNLPDLRITS